MEDWRERVRTKGRRDGDEKKISFTVETNTL